MTQALNKLFKELFDSFFRFLPQSVIFAVLVMFLIIQLKDTDIKALSKVWIDSFKKHKFFRHQFLFFLYLYMIISKTIFSRTTQQNPFNRIMEGWLIEKNDKGVYNFEAIENFLFFIPYIFLFYAAFLDRSQKYKLFTLIKKAFVISFSTSLAIECVQSLFRIGTFQFSDLTYNVLGGIAGALIYYFYTEFIKK